MSGDPLHYRGAGVDLHTAGDAKARIAGLVASARTSGAIGEFGGFGGLFRAPTGMRSPVLVASADGVGTKVKVAIETGRNDTVGNDLVNHCANDILVQGALPLFFLDYVAFGRLDATTAEAIVAGVAAGCRENECALLGGETAEMPGLYSGSDYDLAGFIVGSVEEDAVLGAARVRDGDVLIALESSGLHTNGYSLARKIVKERMRLDYGDPFPEMDASVADVLLTTHRSYVRALKDSLGRIHAMAHITGGGIPGNVDRVIPESLDAVVRIATWEIPPVFAALQSAGNVPSDEMFRVFNMGVGMIVIAPPGDANAVIGNARVAGVVGWVIGEVRPGTGKAILA